MEDSILLDALSNDPLLKREAENKLVLLQHQHTTAEFLGLFIDVLSDDKKDVHVRNSACLILVNLLPPNWFAYEVHDKSRIRLMLLNTFWCGLAISSKLIAKIALREEWPDFPSLLSKFQKPQVFECLTDIASCTSDAIMNNNEDESIQAVAFWTSICQRIVDIGKENANSDPSFLYIKQSFTLLVPLLWQTLCSQKDDQPRETWILAMAGGDCLGLLVQILGDDVFPIVHQFVSKNFCLGWKEKEAARHAFSHLLHDVSLAKLSPLLIPYLNSLAAAVKAESSVHVRSLSASIIRDIFDIFRASTIDITPSVCRNLLNVLAMAAVTDSPNVASKACEAISAMVRHYEEEGSSPSISTLFCKVVVPPDLTISSGWQGIVNCLVDVTNRDNAGEFHLRSVAFKALNEMVRCSPIETIPGMKALYNTLFQTLTEFVTHDNVASDDEKAHFESLWCCLAFILRKLKSWESDSDFVGKLADDLMLLFLTSFNKTVINHTDIPHEQAMLAMGSVAFAIGLSFTKYMQPNHEFSQCLQQTFQKFEDRQLCSATVVVLRDVCRSMKGEIINHYGGIMKLLIEGLQNNGLHQSVTPNICSCFGVIAKVIGDKFDAYLPTVNALLERDIKRICCEEVALEQLKDLRSGILTAYVGMAQSCKDSDTFDLMLPNLTLLLPCIWAVGDDDERDAAELLSSYVTRRNATNLRRNAIVLRSN